MNWLDYTIIAVYLVGFIAMGYFFKENKNSKDYFLGGKSLGWFPLSLSTMATQLSAISFISAPAFVGLKANGGMKWLTFEFGVPLAMIGIMFFIIPPLYKSGIVSIYEYLERRFSKSTRKLISVVFQISRALGTGVMVYTMALIIQSVAGISFHWTLLIISVVTLVYSYQGGMKAVVWGDAIQMIILFSGLIICLIIGYSLLKDTGTFKGFDPERLQVIDFSNLGFFDGEEYGFWPMLLGGFFLYLSYYGTDQTQAQRLLSAKDEGTIRKLLLANGLLRFPVVLVYSIMGLIIGYLVSNVPDFYESIRETTRIYFPAEFAKSGIKPDLMVPVFITKYLPNGLIGILMVGIMSAAMSSLSSTINSLSAVTIEDFFNSGEKKLSEKKYMLISKGLVVFWGVVCIMAAYLFGNSESTVIELINAISSLFYGPILAAFVIAIFLKKVNHIGMNAAIITAVVVNLVFKYLPELVYLFNQGSFYSGDISIHAALAELGIHNIPDLFWIWYNLTGFVIALVVAIIVSKLTSKIPAKQMELSYTFHKKDLLKKESIILMSFFVLIIVVSYFLPNLLS
ncbi:SSS sodium solute transporter superfamily [Winogradskyella psychrotolerans RS-3]|uniref:SSS sodium solute transporter superfamily n=1 Tax=Winogradskyella psychrotolerans RS-3 TaxID=641526 RepID=S7VV58_9FLAO|nr:sodium/solute symporter [Winogradskyella psychrotolerans]EPR73222.1 SSS sodium solute transporter superfamily [Winogradskyella psychrotolerans RS-3]